MPSHNNCFTTIEDGSTTEKNIQHICHYKIQTTQSYWLRRKNCTLQRLLCQSLREWIEYSVVIHLIHLNILRRNKNRYIWDISWHPVSVRSYKTNGICITLTNWLLIADFVVLEISLETLEETCEIAGVFFSGETFKKQETLGRRNNRDIKEIPFAILLCYKERAVTEIPETWDLIKQSWLDVYLKLSKFQRVMWYQKLDDLKEVWICDIVVESMAV